MIYPEFLKEGDTIGIFAPSAGVGHKLERYTSSLEVLKKEGYLIKETASVRKNSGRSAGGKRRAQEYKELVRDEEVKMILCAAGGDFMAEMLPYTDLKCLTEHPKWIMGSSDPTNLLFPLTVKYDIATLYGFNAGYNGKNERFEKDNLRLLKGEIPVQRSFTRYREFIESIREEKRYLHEVSWKSSKGDVRLEGRLIGGCFDVIATLIGTPYDGVKDFIERYKDDGILWYFDNFAFNSLQTYLSLLQMKSAGWFEHCRGILIGRTAFPNEESISYEEAYRRVFRNIPYISEMDIGHTDPHFTLINGALCRLDYKQGKGSLRFFLK